MIKATHQFVCNVPAFNPHDPYRLNHFDPNYFDDFDKSARHFLSCFVISPCAIIPSNVGMLLTSPNISVLFLKFRLKLRRLA